ncbi:uncharacterized protein LOC141936806 [Strix uralensis]|uniref:uncharacterized protein LOC141936806 n=1 Tax=Strix uralensis TaxID=36305 RepID=UPI003DA6EE5F
MGNWGQRGCDGGCEWSRTALLDLWGRGRSTPACHRGRQRPSDALLARFLLPVPVGCPAFAAPSSPNQEPPQFREITGQKRKKIKSSVRQQPVILGDSSGEKQPGTGQAKGKAALKDRASRQSRAQAQALTAQSCRGGGGGNGKGGGWGRGG